MEPFNKYFDDFTFNTRVMPILVILLPIIALGILKGIIGHSWINGTLYILMITVFLSFTSRTARESGKKYESKMFIELGGMPTTIVSRYSDDSVDNLTKTRYHKKLNEKMLELNLPLSIEEEKVDANADDKYKDANNFLRNYANSSRDKEYRVYQELKEYNFWRNLYGTRIMAFIIYLIIAIREFILIEEFNIKNVMIKPYPEYIALIIMLLSIFLLVIYVNKKTVQNKAFDYAKALAEVCERL